MSSTSQPGSLQQLKGRRALVTGGAGFIGSHIAQGLLDHGCSVRVLDDLSGGLRSNVPAGVEFIQASIMDRSALNAAAQGCHYVFHQAAMVSVPESVQEPLRCSDVNVLGTQYVLEAARAAKVQRVMFAASAAAYGNTPTLPCSELHVPDSYSPYAMSKVAGELLLQTYARCYAMSTVSLRYFNVYGPRQNPNSPYAAVISKFKQLVGEGKNPIIFGDGQQTRDFVFVGDVVRANLLAATSPRALSGEVINIGTGTRITLLQVLQHIARVMGRNVSPEHREVRAGDIRDSVADIAKARAVLAYEPTVEFAQGIERTLKA
ncbi:MAG: NAD-dependent epimerase/dehydratase family protein [Phycisphaerales bacterium]|nr:NAD-dependent epimerase/dehydratase family protein [Phycisphaerales bacterium]